MGDKNYWFGYLEAGEKSTPVLRDDSIDTGNSDTIYLFNLKRNEILEYRRDIIEPKLRELNADEKDVCAEMQSAYTETRRGFTPRGGKVATIPQKGRSKPTAAANDETDDQDDRTDDFGDDADVEWAEEEA